MWSSSRRSTSSTSRTRIRRCCRTRPSGRSSASRRKSCPHGSLGWHCRSSSRNEWLFGGFPGGRVDRLRFGRAALSQEDGERDHGRQGEELALPILKRLEPEL